MAANPEPSLSPLEPPASSVDAPPDSEGFRGVPWQLNDVLLGLAVLVPYRALGFLDRKTLGSMSPWVYWGVLFFPVYAWLLLYPFWIAKRRQPSFRLRVPPPEKMGREAAIGFGSTLAMWVMLGAIFFAWASLFGKDTLPRTGREGLENSSSVVSVWVYLVLVFTVGPVAEEVFCRGFLYNALRHYCPAVMAGILQAAVFGLMHPFGLAHAAVAGFLGLFLVALYEWRKTLLTPIFVHALHNFVGSVAAAAVIIAAANAPFLGVGAEPAPLGARVTQVVPDSPAEECGIRAGDIITTLDGKPVRGPEDMSPLVRKKKTGDVVRLELLRDGKTVTTEATLRKRPSPQ